MDVNYIAKLSLFGFLLLVLGAGLGYYYAPDKVKTEIKTVEVEKKVVEENHKTTKEFDPATGKVTKEVDEIGTKTTDLNTTKVDKETEKYKDQKHYAIKAGAVKALTNTNALTYRVGAEVRLPFFNTWLGGEFDIDLKDPRGGIYGRMEF